MQLHGQKLCVFDDITCGMGPCWEPGAVLVGFHPLMEVTEMIPESADVAMCFCIPVGITRLCEQISSFPPSSWCSSGLPRKREKEQNVPTPSLSLVAAPTGELALPKEGKVRRLKAQSQISANPRRTGIKYKHVHSALQHCHGSATLSQILSTLQRTNNQIALTISSATADY